MGLSAAGSSSQDLSWVGMASDQLGPNHTPRSRRNQSELNIKTHMADLIVAGL